MIFVGSDHAGFELKEKLKKWLDELGYKYKDLGAYSFDPNDDYPDYGVKVCEKVLETKGKGILICGTGQGMDRVANKIPDIHAAVCWNETTAKYAREHGNTNVLALGGQSIDVDTAKRIVKIWLETPFTEEKRHVRRINKIKEIEKNHLSYLIKTRRSIRKYQKKEVPDNLILKILDLARYAPSSQNSQPWEFVIVRDTKIKESLAKIKGEENKECILSAPVIVAVCVDTKKSESRWVEDGVCAAMNILLAAHGFGLGAVYVTGYSPSKPEVTKKLKEILKLLDYVMPVCLIPMGYPDETPKKKELRNLKGMIHYDK